MEQIINSVLKNTLPKWGIIILHQRMMLTENKFTILSLAACLFVNVNAGRGMVNLVSMTLPREVNNVCILLVYM